MWVKLKSEHLFFLKRVFKLGSQVKTDLQKEKKDGGQKFIWAESKKMLGKIYVDVAVRGTCRKVHFEINPKDLNPTKKRSDPNQSSKLEKNDQRLHPYALENGQLLIFICQQSRA